MEFIGNVNVMFFASLYIQRSWSHTAVVGVWIDITLYEHIWDLSLRITKQYCYSVVILMQPYDDVS